MFTDHSISKLQQKADEMNSGKQKRITQKTKLSSCGKPQNQLADQYIALDCEMVGIGIGGKTHMVARVSIVNQIGEILIDKYVKPQRSVSVRLFSVYSISNLRYCLNLVGGWLPYGV